MKVILPASRPQATKEKVRALIPAEILEAYKVILVGVRGYYLDTMGLRGSNDVGIYDDAIFVYAPTKFMSFNGNTDPSVLKSTIAVLKPGVHLYRKGKHKIASPTGYPALRPATSLEKLPVTRGGKDDWGIAINIHKGSFNSTSSEGCQTIYPVQWPEFQLTVYSLMDQYNQKVIPYVLINES